MQELEITSFLITFMLMFCTHRLMLDYQFKNIDDMTINYHTKYNAGCYY